MNAKVIFVFPLMFSCIASAQLPGTFTSTGSMITPRVQHSATLLPDGKVLIAGGLNFSPYSFLDSAELYDPSIGAFTPTGSMAVPRSAHTATLLPNGTVLIAGGEVTFPDGSASVRASAEIYNPSTGTFTSAGNMTTPRAGHTATLLNNGMVLIAGGAPSGRTAELYDSSTGTFNPTGDMTIARSSHRATLLATGKVLIVPGGLGKDYQAELYDPSSGTFNPTGWLTTVGGVAYTANLVNSGAVLVVLAPGDCDYPQADAQLYDPATQEFSATARMVMPRCYETGTSLSDGSVLISGGLGVCGVSYDGSISCSNSYSAELYDSGSQRFISTGNMITSVTSFTTTLLKDGTVLIAGGIDAIGPLNSPIAGAEIYHPLSVTAPPALFSLWGDGRGQGAIWHSATGQIASGGMPAVTGEPLSMYTTSLVDGSVIPPQVAIGGQLAEILFFGAAPGYPGFNQVNVRVPAGIAPGSAVPVRLTYLGRPSNDVTIAVQ